MLDKLIFALFLCFRPSHICSSHNTGFFCRKIKTINGFSGNCQLYFKGGWNGIFVYRRTFVNKVNFSSQSLVFCTLVYTCQC